MFGDLTGVPSHLLETAWPGSRSLSAAGLVEGRVLSERKLSSVRNSVVRHELLERRLELVAPTDRKRGGGGNYQGPGGRRHDGVARVGMRRRRRRRRRRSSPGRDGGEGLEEVSGTGNSCREEVNVLEGEHCGWRLEGKFFSHLADLQSLLS